MKSRSQLCSLQSRKAQRRRPSNTFEELKLSGTLVISPLKVSIPIKKRSWSTRSGTSSSLILCGFSRMEREFLKELYKQLRLSWKKANQRLVMLADEIHGERHSLRLVLSWESPRPFFGPSGEGGERPDFLLDSCRCASDILTRRLS